jgi:anaphase-promoting complex subunit 2
MRKIFFHYNLGYVNLTLTFDNGSFDFKCSPIQAMMVTYFDEEKMKDPASGVSSEELSVELHIAQNVVKQKMSFWVHKGVVK